jgi:hypothetical protein
VEPVNVQTSHVSINRNEVIAALRQRNIPFEDWGKVEASKPLDKLIESLEKGEIKWDYNNPLDSTLHITAAVIHICHSVDDIEYELRERHRDFKNGYRDYRREWDGSISEKIGTGETERGIAMWGLAKKLGQSEPEFTDPNNYSLLKLRNEKKEPRPTKSYPPLEVIYDCRIFRCCIVQEKIFRAEYVFVDPLKTTYFGWLKLMNNCKI